MVNPSDLEKNKQRFIDLMRSVPRNGVEELLDFLETKTDFYTAPASTKFHNNCDGGLLAHTLNVYENFKKLLAMRNIEMAEESVVVTSLLHDLCKCNFYVKDLRNRKNPDGKWEQYTVWTQTKNVAVLLPHSSRSIRIIRSYLPLKFLEELCIFYHMGPFGGEDYEYRNMLQQVNTKHPETLLFYTADLMSSYLDEVTYDL